MVEKIYLARHGFRLNWVTSNWKSETGLARDPPLASYGVSQAQELADYFVSLPEDERPTAIFSSPYYRCLQTSQPVARALGIPIFVEHGISEWYSPVAPKTGLHPRPGSATELQAYFPEISAEWSSIYYPSRRGEDVQQVHVRCEEFLSDFIPQVRRKFEGKHSHILLVSHAATVIAIARGLLADRTVPLRVGCCSLSEFEKQSENLLGRWKGNKLADGTHMVNGSERDWGFEDIEIAQGKVVEDPGVPGSETEEEGPIGSQIASHL
ncbi:phosphoglycerate mutase-like protein [Mycena floridula]|nr:phosphoglycerate mutase-like protein [Mycena floridula]